MAKNYRNVVPFSELTKREKYLCDNPSENKNKGYGGYYKTFTVKTYPTGMIKAMRNRCWFWRYKPSKR